MGKEIVASPIQYLAIMQAELCNTPYVSSSTGPDISYPALLGLGGTGDPPVSVGDEPTESWSNRVSS
jgi:hypothetical protein